MQSVTETGTARRSSPRLIQGLRKARNAVLTTLAIAASLGAAQAARAAEGQPAPAPASAPTTAPTPAGPPITAVRVTTSMGAFVIELNADRAPITVQNFVR